MRRHKHDWDMIDKTETPPPFTLPGHVFPADTGTQDPRIFTRGKVVLVFKCACGKVRIEERYT